MNHPSTVKSLLVSLAILVGVIVGLVTGIVARLAGKSVAAAIRDGGIAFGGTVTLMIVILTALGLVLPLAIRLHPELLVWCPAARRIAMVTRLTFAIEKRTKNILSRKDQKRRRHGMGGCLH